MSRLQLKPQGRTGRVHHVTPESAGWAYVGFDLHRLAPGDSLSAETHDREVCLVLVSGKAVVHAGRHDFGEIGQRMTPFEGQPFAVYVPAGDHWSVDATSAAELAVCSAPGVRDTYAPRLIPPGSHPPVVRGKGSNTRHVTDILPETEPAHSLLVVEVITPNGNTSSYPPHRHDEDDFPRQTLLEESYFHRLNPPQGFGFQRVYTDDRSLDEAIAFEDGDVVLVPKGYHPVATVHGYDSYYLNVMAGPRRAWKFYNAPEHEWLLR
ncbi:MAG TPA: 5-deoxy-glucuronate isomerase [Devosiaceae bacterium]|jgi:5-deoxy-glucuronate isomerase|nr:5-deoxy-glucuronate isomerase [Devosiaceae bacterium]